MDVRTKQCSTGMWQVAAASFREHASAEPNEAAMQRERNQLLECFYDRAVAFVAQCESHDSAKMLGALYNSYNGNLLLWAMRPLAGTSHIVATSPACFVMPLWAIWAAHSAVREDAMNAMTLQGAAYVSQRTRQLEQVETSIQVQLPLINAPTTPPRALRLPLSIQSFDVFIAPVPYEQAPFVGPDHFMRPGWESTLYWAGRPRPPAEAHEEDASYHEDGEGRRRERVAIIYPRGDDAWVSAYRFAEAD